MAQKLAVASESRAPALAATLVDELEGLSAHTSTRRHSSEHRTESSENPYPRNSSSQECLRSFPFAHENSYKYYRIVYSSR